ncbi:solute carrier family 15 member 5 [Erpetoichthys calabaricus]|uniref:solute carrier family 15 member 5 n=1 Tax=Erpetoichthys calabaricus TaxID=27687 RepID=UPI00109F7B7B|nr:solute carrier family 15 member 5 [Erpetoichthys calabaricus]
MAAIDLQEKDLLKKLPSGRHKFSKKSAKEHHNKHRGRKKLEVIVCILLVELCERFTFYGIVCNMILFCTVKLGYSNYEAATINLTFVGVSTLAPVFVGQFAEFCLGRTKVLYSSAFLHFIGTAMLPVVAFPFEDFYIDTNHIVHSLAKTEQMMLFYVGLLSACLGIGGIRAILCPLSAYRLKHYNQHELLSFFNWFYWLVNLNSAVVFVGIAYIQQSIAKNLGFLIPFTSVLMALITIHMVRNNLIVHPKKGQSLLSTFGVFLSSLKLGCLHYRYITGELTSWLDWAKENNGGCYSETHVENIKILVKLFPLFVLQLLYRATVTQIPSGYYIQTLNSNLNLKGFLLPIAAMNVISIIPLLVIAPLLECIAACLLSWQKYSLSPTTLIVSGHLCAALSASVAGFSELHRKCYPTMEQVISGKVLHVSSMPCFHLAPQYMLLGISETLVNPACSLLAFRLTPSSIRGISSHFLTLSNGGGCFLGAFIIQVMYLASGGFYFPDTLAEGKMEVFFFLLGTMMTINAFIFWSISSRYKNLSQDLDHGVKSSVLAEKLVQHEHSLMFYDSVGECTYTLSSTEMTL